MVKQREACGSGGGGLEWRINMPDGTSKVLAVAAECSSFMSNMRGFFQEGWKLGVEQPRKFLHCLKVGMALCFVSLFYYMRPLYDGVGGSSMWAVMTVVVVFEYTVGAMLSKCLNRVTGTFLAGALGVGVHWIAAQSGPSFEPIILQASVFILAAAVTFSRFIPSIKARFDYGALIFILTFSLVSVSGYRVDKLIELAQYRLSTIAIGTSICIIIGMLISPVWAGTELHKLLNNNMEKLADSLDGCAADYFMDHDNSKPMKESKAYKCVLNSKATEESLANFARWEPAHGQFSFGHPWEEYLKIGASLRSCACCIEALNGTIYSDAEAPDFLKKHFSSFCMRLSSRSSAVLKEVAVVFSMMTKSTKLDLMVEEMKSGVGELQDALGYLSSEQRQSIGSTNSDSLEDADASPNPTIVGLMEIVPLVTLSSLLIEISARIEKVVGAVNTLAEKAEFRDESGENQKASNRIIGESEMDKTMMTFHKV